MKIHSLYLQVGIQNNQLCISCFCCGYFNAVLNAQNNAVY